MIQVKRSKSQAARRALRLNTPRHYPGSVVKVCYSLQSAFKLILGEISNCRLPFILSGSLLNLNQKRQALPAAFL